MKPRLSRKARVRADPRDGRPVLLSPERGLRLSDSAAAILALCDGTRDLGDIVEALATRFGQPPATILRDTRGLLADLHARALIEGFVPEAGDAVSARADAASSDGKGPSPYTLVAELTHRCPLACPYCSNPKALVRRGAELGADDWRRVIDEAASLGVMQVHLSGGEPLARSDLEAIAAHAKSRDLYVNLVTSGIPLDEGRLERLAPSIDHVQLSVQDADPASSDRIAGLPSHDEKMRVAAWVKRIGLPLTLNVVLHRENLDRVGDIVALAERASADRLELANVQMVTWALDNAPALLPTRNQIDHARQVAADARTRLSGRMEVVFVLPDWYADRPRACMDGWARRFVVVAPDGTVLPCHAARSLPLPFESVRSAPLGRIWRDSEAMKAFRGEVWMPEPCATCDRRTIDFGGCRCQAFALTGDLRATDPACALAPAHAIVEQARARAEQRAKLAQRGAHVADAEVGAPPVPWVYRGR